MGGAVRVQWRVTSKVRWDQSHLMPLSSHQAPKSYFAEVSKECADQLIYPEKWIIYGHMALNCQFPSLWFTYKAIWPLMNLRVRFTFKAIWPYLWVFRVGLSKGTRLVLKGGSMGRHHMGLIQKHPEIRSCLILSTNDSVGWQTECFSCLVGH